MNLRQKTDTLLPTTVVVLAPVWQCSFPALVELFLHPVNCGISQHKNAVVAPNLASFFKELDKFIVDIARA